MGDPRGRIEYETMLIGRHRDMMVPHATHGDRRLDRSAYLLLSRIRVEGPMSIGQLSEAFGLDASTLNRQTSAILRAGLVERIPDPQGGIARKFRITDEGLRRLEHERAENLQGLEKVLAGWTAEEISAFADQLTRFNTDIERLTGRPWPRS
ncbi:MarR family winged helix-turn-helix transcriptional regulator [Actinomadura vinacea]|uniref:MarR family winged helix-turn-helix transcriptional regulator n=1 Tax=Actinomadura vinacea TaxID=115336 RepID=A0ABN3IFG1_9ACTN